MKTMEPRPVKLTNFGEAKERYNQTCVSTIEVTRIFTHGFPEPTALKHFSTVIFWDDNPLNDVERITLSEPEALAAHAECCELVNQALLAIVSTY